MLAVAGLIGADARVPSMVLQRAPLGRRGSYLATGLNVLQCLGWSIFELIVIATAAAALSDRVFGFHATWLWKLVFGGLATVARAARAGRVRAAVRPQDRDLGRSARRSSTSRTGSSPTATCSALWHARRPGRLVLARGRPRDRALGLVDPARRRLHALLDARAAPPSGASGSATCCRRSSSSASARSSCSRTRRSTGRSRC